MTLSAPFGLALFVLLISYGYGVKGCFALRSLLRMRVRELCADNLLKKAFFRKRLKLKLASSTAQSIDEASCVEQLKLNHLSLEESMAKLLLKEASFWSCLKVWIIVVFFKKVQFDPSSNTLWFALCPILLVRLKTRMERSAKENWSLARMKIKMRRLLHGMLHTRRTTRFKPDPAHDEKLQVYMRLIAQFHLDVWFQKQCDTGRKFVSGIASIFVLTYAGSITSALSAWNCQMRGGKQFVMLDPETECSAGAFSSWSGRPLKSNYVNVKHWNTDINYFADNPKYRILLIISILGIIVYCVVLPLLIWSVLTSKWCRRFYTSERAGFEGMLGFLTQRYSRKAYLWEIVVFLKKFLAAAIPIYFSSSQTQQAILSMFVYFSYLLCLFKTYPLATLKLNQVRSLSLPPLRFCCGCDNFDSLTD